jgi:putative effector of murein hydrolase LrgA (UPF0299 family)
VIEQILATIISGAIVGAVVLYGSVKVTGSRLDTIEKSIDRAHARIDELFTFLKG